MDLKSYLQSLGNEDERAAFAASCETTPGHMRNAAYGTRSLSPETCVLAERASKGQLMRWDLRSDWRRIWPELIGAPCAPAIGEQLAPLESKAAA